METVITHTTQNTRHIYELTVILVSTTLINKVHSEDIRSKIWTDHLWVECQIKLMDEIE